MTDVNTNEPVTEKECAGSQVKVHAGTTADLLGHLESAVHELASMELSCSTAGLVLQCICMIAVLVKLSPRTYDDLFSITTSKLHDVAKGLSSEPLLSDSTSPAKGSTGSQPI